MAGYGLALLSGLLQGLGGLPKGMHEADQLALAQEQLGLRQQALDEQRRQFDQSRTTDLSALSNVLGVNLGAVPTAAVPTVVAQAVKRSEDARLRQQNQAAADAMLRANTTIGLKPDTTLSAMTPGSGALLQPPAPATAVAQANVPTALKSLYTALPFLSPSEGQKAIHEYVAPKPVVVGENASLVNPITGQPIIGPRPGAPVTPFTPPPNARAIPTVNAKGEVSTRYEPPPWQQDVAAKALADAGWRSDMPGYHQALYQLMTPLTPVTEGGFAAPRTMAVPPPPTGAIRPDLPPGQQPTVQAAGRELSNALATMGQVASGLPGVPPPAAPRGPQRMPGGGIQGPPKSQGLPAEQASKIADIRTFLTALDQAETLFKPEYVGPVQGRLGGLRQQLDLPAVGLGTTPAETQFRTVLQSFANQLLYLRSGAAVTPQEYERITRELPTANDPPTVFTAKLQTARSLLQAALKNRESEFSQSGFRGVEPRSEGASAPAAPPRRRYNQATGQFE